MMLAVPSTSDQGCLQANESVELNLEYLNKAIEFHRAHLQVADAGGQFVAHSNLGLCFGMLRDWAQAGQHHQEALRIAIKLQTLYGQSIAVGNLGLLALTKGDTQTAKTCLEQHLQLVQTLQDVEAEVNAWEMVNTSNIAKLHILPNNKLTSSYTFSNSSWRLRHRCRAAPQPGWSSWSTRGASPAPSPSPPSCGASTASWAWPGARHPCGRTCRASPPQLPPTPKPRPRRRASSFIS